MTILAANIFTLAVLASELPGAVPVASAEQVFKADGQYQDSSGKCVVRISTSPMGGFSRLHLPAVSKSRLRIVDDVTGVAFSANGMVVYTTSTIYGQPGVFRFDCAKKSTRRLVGPRRFEASYPGGLDYFELAKIADDNIFYYYAPDVNQVALARLRNTSHLSTVDFTGSNVRRVES